MSRHSFSTVSYWAIVLCTIVLNHFAYSQASWDDAQDRKEATLDLYWYTSKPFIYKDQDGRLVGVEHDMLAAFQDFVASRYKVDLKLNWVEANSFSGIIDKISHPSQAANSFGVSAFSITEERRQKMRFTEPYFPDITVLVSSQGTEIVDSYDAIHKLLNMMTAVTIKGTTYEGLLLDLQEDLNEEMKMLYIESDQNILDYISKSSDRFGFIDLPIYLMLVENGGELVRQNFFTVKGTGYGLVMPLASDWNVPFDEFLADPESQDILADILSKYLGNELYQFIHGMDEEEQLGTSILTKEKEIQLELIKNANLKLEEEQAFKKMLILGIVISGLFLLIVGILFFNNSRKTRTLLRQKAQIEEQQADIRRKNEQLMNRHMQLMSIMEDKNHLVRILAHDLRAPLQQIVGFVDLMIQDEITLSEEDSERLQYINKAGWQMNSMINRILQEEVVDADKSLVLHEPVDILSIMQDVINRYQTQAEQKNITLNLVRCEEGNEIESDHLLLYLIIENLVSNAIKFSGSETTVTLSAVCRPEEVILKVEDQGPGFTEEDKLLLFNRFQKLSARPTGGESSTGLGLSIVKKYVTELGGKVMLDSELGKGSVFSVIIPV